MPAAREAVVRRLFHLDRHRAELGDDEARLRRSDEVRDGRVERLDRRQAGQQQIGAARRRRGRTAGR